MAETSGSPKYKIVVTGKGMKIDQEIDQSTARRIVALLLGDDVPAEQTPAPARSRTAARGRTRRRTQAKSGDGSKRQPRRRPGGTGVIKTLSMRPSGKKAFKPFVAEKQPRTHQQQQAVILFWLKHEAGMADGITPDHVNTCYQEAGWRRPADMENSLAVTAAKKGWLDTSNYEDVTITPRGEDMVRHDLPPKAQDKK